MTTAAPGARQQQTQVPQPPGPLRLVSDEQLVYMNAAAVLQRQALADPTLNGSDTAGRLKLYE